VQALLAARLEFEMLYRNCDVSILARDTGFSEGAVENLAGRSDKRPALAIFLVARLLANKDDPSMGATFAEHGLGGILVERTTAAIRRFAAQRR
jgi:hypothetical protein